MADITIHVDNAKGVEFLNACEKAAEMDQCHIKFTLEPQQGGESDIAFGKRSLISLAKALMKKVGQDVADQNYRDEVAAIVHAEYEPDNDILT